MILLLVRHAHTEAIGRFIAGRMPGIPLSEEGRRQARELAERLAPVPLAAVYTSPLDRARETAAALAAGRDIPVRVVPGLTEIDYGRWTGLAFRALRTTAEWQVFNWRRSAAIIPGGETMADAQVRMVAALEGIALRGGEAPVAAVSHADVIKAAVCHYAGISVDLVPRMSVDPASVTALAFDDGGPRLLCLNAATDLGALLARGGAW